MSTCFDLPARKMAGELPQVDIAAKTFERRLVSFMKSNNVNERKKTQMSAAIVGPIYTTVGILPNDPPVLLLLFLRWRNRAAG